MSQKKITVTKSFLPPMEEYTQQIELIWQNGQLTTFGPMVQELMQRLCERFQVEDMLFVGNGTLALQIALKTLNIKGEVITTPFSYIATTSAIVWESAVPVFADIDSQTLNIDPTKIEEKITDKTTAILATHVFGNPCEIEKIETIAKKHQLKVIYDAAHCFDVEYKGKSIFQYGDMSTASFHATKVFHSIEGGGVFCSDKAQFEKALAHGNFGHDGPLKITTQGINAKNSEFHAAMGLVNLQYIDEIISKRKKLSFLYDNLLKNNDLYTPHFAEGVKKNYTYYPIILPSEKVLLDIEQQLNQENIFPRRYFYPSLNELPYIQHKQAMPISESITKRILCLPLYETLEKSDIERICKIVRSIV